MTSIHRPPFAIPVATLHGKTGKRRDHVLASELADVGTSLAVVTTDPVRVEVTLEAVPDGIMAYGDVHAVWKSQCRRCLDDVSGPLDVGFRELFQVEPVVGESYSLGLEDLDLEPMLREALSLELPLAPLCGSDCAGPDPDGFPVTPPDADSPEGSDPRWAALDDLNFE